MKRYIYLSILIIVWFTATGLSYAEDPVGLRSNTLILLRDMDISAFLQLCAQLENEGFIAFHKVPPHTIIGYDPGNIAGTAGQSDSRFMLVTLKPVEIADYPALSYEQKLMVNAWNNLLMVYKGIIPEELRTGELEDHAGKDPDMIIHPDLLDRSKLKTLNKDMESEHMMAPAPLGAGFSDTTEFYIGNVVVTVICPESNGVSDPNIENWTTAEETLITTNTTTAFDQIMTEEGRGLLKYTYKFRYKEPCNYEAVRHWMDSALWISHIMDNLGYTTYSDSWAKTRAFCNDQRDLYDADWAHVVFMVDVSNTGGQRAYAYLGGPYNLNDTADHYSVIMHETGHIFYALDEYSSSGCTCNARAGYLDIDNQNCENGACLIDVGCRMIWNTPPFCKYSKGQIGWMDTDKDGLPDVVDTFPETTLNEYTPDPTASNELTYTGSTTVVPLENRNRYGAGSDISINTISLVEYRVDHGPWLPATATDSLFDGPAEDFQFTTARLLNGTHLIEVRATNNYGNVESTYAYDYVTVASPPSTAVPTPTGGWKSPTLIPSQSPTINFTYVSGTRTPTPPFTLTPTQTPTTTPTSVVKVNSFPFCDSFENGLDNWYINAEGSGNRPMAAQDNTLNGGLVPVDGNYVAFLGDRTDAIDCEGTFDMFINLSGEPDVMLDFWWVVYNGTGTRGIQLDIFDGSWHYSVQGARFRGGTWERQLIDLDADYNTDRAFIMLRFRWYFTYTEYEEGAYLDAVCLYPSGSPPTFIPTATSSPTGTSTPTDTPDLIATKTPTPTFTPTSLKCPYSFTLDTDPGWTLEGNWAFGKPMGVGGVEAGYPDPSRGRTGNNVYGYNLMGDYANDIPVRYYLTSKPVDCSFMKNVLLSFWGYLNVEGYVFDQATVEVSTNGVNWVTIWHNDVERQTDNKWNFYEFNISRLVDYQPAVYVRWGLGPTDESIPFSGWNIDDIHICGNYGSISTPTPEGTPVNIISRPGSFMLFMLFLINASLVLSFKKLLYS